MTKKAKAPRKSAGRSVARSPRKASRKALGQQAQADLEQAEQEPGQADRAVIAASKSLNEDLAYLLGTAEAAASGLSDEQCMLHLGVEKANLLPAVVRARAAHKRAEAQLKKLDEARGELLALVDTILASGLLNGALDERAVKTAHRCRDLSV